jgi:hypothetical protein
MARTINIDITDVGGNAHPGDYVVFSATSWRASADNPNRVISTAPQRVHLNAGRADVANIEPGLLRVEFHVRNQRINPITVKIPEGEGAISLRELMGPEFAPTPEENAAVQSLAARIDNIKGSLDEFDQRLDVARDELDRLVAKYGGVAPAAPTPAPATPQPGGTPTPAPATPKVTITEADVTRIIAEYIKAHPPTSPNQAEPLFVAEQVTSELEKIFSKQLPVAVERNIKEKIDAAVRAADGAAVVTVTPAAGGKDITDSLQAALTNPAVKVIKIPAGEWTFRKGLITTKNTSGKVVMGAGKDATTITRPAGTQATFFTAGSGDALHHVTFTGFTVDMTHSLDPTLTLRAFQITNAEFVDFLGVGIKNAGSHGILLQGYATKEKATGVGSSDCRVIQCDIDGAGLVQAPAGTTLATGHGITIKDESLRNQILNNRIRGVSCGMGINGTHTTSNAFPQAQRLGEPKHTMVSGNMVVMAENMSIAFEPIGFTSGCEYTSIIGNQMPVSKDNGISVGGYSVVSSNVIGEAWNHGVACSGNGTVVSDNIISNVGLENVKRPPKDGPKEWAAVAFEDPNECVATGNSYRKTNADSQCTHMIKVVLRDGTRRDQVGGNIFAWNMAQPGSLMGEFVKNGNFNPAKPDIVVTIDMWNNLRTTVLDLQRKYDEMVKRVGTLEEKPAPAPANPTPAPADTEKIKQLETQLGKLAEQLKGIQAAPPAAGGTPSALIKALETREGPIPGKDIHPFNLWTRGARRLAPVTYSWPKYWEAIEHARDVTANYFHNPDIAGPFIANPHSGVGTKKEQDYELTLTATANLGMVNIAYVLTQWGGRAHSEIIKEIDQFISYYGRNRIHGVFLDEAVNGWGAQESKVQGYVTLYQELRKKYGPAFYIVANPGGNTVEGMLNAADTIMAFEQSAQRYIDDETICPGHYRGQNPLRFWHAVHNVNDTEQAKQVLRRASVSNVGQIWLTSDTFTGELGSESEWNNPWDNAPDKDILREEIQWVRRLGEYMTPQEFG